jgi:two-component system sensor kinase FixL
LYEQVVEQLPAGAVLRHGDRITVNLAAEAITGHSRDELPTVDAWCAALHGNRASEFRPRYEAAGSSAATAQPISLAITRKDGQTRHVELTACRLDDTHDLWMLLDMTERDRAERELHRSEDYLRSIVNTAADAIITADEHGAIQTFNAAAERMFGYAMGEIQGQALQMLMPPPYRAEYEELMTRNLQTGEARLPTSGRESVGLRKDGTTFPMSLAVSQIDHRRRVTAILHDLTHRRQLEWRLAESHTEERRHMARELHDEIGGHMTGIGLLAQTLQAELARTGSPLAGRTQELVDSIRDAHQRLRSVIRGLMPVETIPEGLMAALQHLAQHCEATSGIACRFRCDPPVHVDEPVTALHLFRIAQEAVSNAVRHARPAHITISLAEAAQRLEIVVADDGRGIGERPAGGAGLGMDGMRQRARLLGGDIVVQSRDGGGTVVTCAVPPPSARTDARAQRPDARG